jgi:hypothetical protein
MCSGMRMFCTITAVWCFCASTEASAQRVDVPLGDQFAAEAVAPRTAAPPSALAAFGIEALGGVGGAALGYGALMLTGDDLCGEDLTCTLRNAGAALLLGTVGAGLGSYAAGRVFGTEPSGLGALAGAIAGAAAVIALDHAAGEMSDGTRVAVFALTHGTIAALGSRIAAALR